MRNQLYSANGLLPFQSGVDVGPFVVSFQLFGLCEKELSTTLYFISSLLVFYNQLLCEYFVTGKSFIHVKMTVGHNLFVSLGEVTVIIRQYCVVDVPQFDVIGG